MQFFSQLCQRRLLSMPTAPKHSFKWALNLLIAFEQLLTPQEVRDALNEVDWSRTQFTLPKIANYHQCIKQNA